MTEIEFRIGELTPEEQAVVSTGFSRHSSFVSAPPLEKIPLSWLVHDQQQLIGVLTADVFWDWMYVDELWVADPHREKGLGTMLMTRAEEYAGSENLQGLWLWTQSWQAADFYKKIGYQEFTHFDDFPKGYSRIGLRKFSTMKRGKE